jgi:hypothetical protein
VIDEWGEWQIHDGQGTPPNVIGHFIHMIGTKSELRHFISRPYQGFDWERYGKPIAGGSGVWDKIIRYRIRKPRGMIILEGLLENLPKRVNA